MLVSDDQLKAQVEAVSSMLAAEADAVASQGMLLLSGRILTARQVIRALWTALENAAAPPPPAVDADETKEPAPILAVVPEPGPEAAHGGS